MMEKFKCYAICSYASNSMKSDNPNSGIYEAKTSRTLGKLSDTHNRREVSGFVGD